MEVHYTWAPRHCPGRRAITPGRRTINPGRRTIAPGRPGPWLPQGTPPKLTPIYAKRSQNDRRSPVTPWKASYLCIYIYTQIPDPPPVPVASITIFAACYSPGNPGNHGKTYTIQKTYDFVIFLVSKKYRKGIHTVPFR